MNTGVEIKSLSSEIYQYRVMSVSHIYELKKDIDKLKEDGSISDNETFRNYIEGAYKIPEDIQTPKSLIVLAIYTPRAKAVFHHQGDEYEITIPHQYYHSGITRAQIEETVHEKIIGEEGYSLDMAHGNVLLKQVAVRSGLGKYGKNNICYVDGMGSFITLHAFWTNFEFAQDDWNSLELMEECTNCTSCLNRCPTNAIRKNNFVIDAGRCLSLYNEVNGEFPDWISPEAHNALMGCIQCQEKCPGNRESIQDLVKLGTVTEEETTAILNGEFSITLSDSLSQKLNKFPPATSDEYFPIFTRNLGVLLNR